MVDILNIGQQDTKKKGESVEQAYAALPIFQIESFAKECGFDFQSLTIREKRTLFEKFIVEQFVDTLAHPPAWLLTALYTEKHRVAKAAGQAVPRFITERETAVIQGWSQLPQNELKEIASKLLHLDTSYFKNPEALHDVVVALLDRISTKYPNICFFRGGDFSSSNGGQYEGYSFTLGDISQSLEFSYQGVYGGPREYPVLVSLPVRSVVDRYTHGTAHISSERKWFLANSTDLIAAASDRIGDTSFPEAVLYRPPLPKPTLEGINKVEKEFDRKKGIALKPQSFSILNLFRF